MLILKIHFYIERYFIQVLDLKECKNKEVTCETPLHLILPNHKDILESRGDPVPLDVNDFAFLA